MDYSLALKKMALLCSKSEKCIFDVKEKLKKLEISVSDTNKIIDYLVNNSYIDEKRYARSFVNDKFKFNYWGKIKIQHYLSMKNIDDKIIQEAFEVIDEEQYKDILIKLLKEKLRKIKPADNAYETKAKLFRFAASRGFEPDLFYKVVEKLC